MLNLRDARKEKGLKQIELANLINVSIQTISGYETGYAQPPIDILVKIADALEVSTDYLLGRSNDVGIIQTNANLTDFQNNLLTVVARLPRDDQYQVLGFAQALAR